MLCHQYLHGCVCVHELATLCAHNSGCNLHLPVMCRHKCQELGCRHALPSLSARLAVFFYSALFPGVDVSVFGLCSIIHSTVFRRLV